MIITKKLCIKCGRILDYSDFHKSKESKDGLNFQCKECKSKYDREKNEKLKWETMMALGGRCVHVENGVRCDKNVFTDLNELELIHPHNNGNAHRDLISNGRGSRDFYNALKDRNYDTDGFLVEIMCKSHHRIFDRSGKKNSNYGKYGRLSSKYKEGRFNNPAWLKKKYETMSIREIGDLCGVNHHIIHSRMKEFGLSRRPSGRSRRR